MAGMRIAPSAFAAPHDRHADPEQTASTERLAGGWSCCSRCRGHRVAGMWVGRLRCFGAGFAIALMSWPIPPWSMPPCPMSAMVSVARGSSSGTAARRPSRTASVPAANPVRSLDCAKIVKASWPVRLDDHVVGFCRRNPKFVDGHRMHVLAIRRHDGHLQTRDTHVEVRHRRPVDEAETNALAWFEHPRPVRGGWRAVHQVGVGVAGHVGEIRRRSSASRPTSSAPQPSP